MLNYYGHGTCWLWRVAHDALLGGLAIVLHQPVPLHYDPVLPETGIFDYPIVIITHMGTKDITLIY